MDMIDIEKRLVSYSGNAVEFSVTRGELPAHWYIAAIGVDADEHGSYTCEYGRIELPTNINEDMAHTLADKANAVVNAVAQLHRVTQSTEPPEGMPF